MTHTNTTNTSILESLLRCMRNNEDFPALSTTISEINNAVSSDHSSTQSLSKVILQDFSLTNKLLKIVNTVSYGQFGGKISTISKAVVILGFDVVRDIATTLTLIDFLQNKSQAAQLTDHVILSFFAGLTARQLTFNLNLRNYEEAMICGTFQQLGQLLTTFYFFDKSQKIDQLISEGMLAKQASLTVLGISYEDFGIGVAKSWNFPARLLHGMQGLQHDRVGSATNELDQLNTTVCLASELTTIVSSFNGQDKIKAIQQLVKKYKNAFHLDEKLLQETLEQSLQEMAVRAKILNIATKESSFLKRVSEYTNNAQKTQILQNDQQVNTEVELPGGAYLGEAINLTESSEKLDTESILQAGIQEVINTLVSDYKLNDVLQMILETMYRGLGCNRVLMILRDVKTNQMHARFGYGNVTESLLSDFKFPLNFTPDVFYLAIDSGSDIVIEDTDMEAIVSKIPPWYKKISSAKSFLLLPVMVNKKAVGCFYADMQTPNAFNETSKNLGLLRTLRNQAVLAIKQNQK